MSSVDSRIVTMKFDNSGFQRAVAITLQTLQKLKDSLNFSKSKKSLDELQTAGNRFNMNGMGQGVDGISAKFVALSAVAITALANIVNRAVDSGLRLAKAFTIDPIATGLHEYEQTLEATQTIMSATGESTAQVTKTLKDLNAYSDQTIFAFSDMTDNIKHFTNAGLSSEKAARVMKGIANAAAAAGANAESAGRAMYGFGQSMSMGFVGLQDWNQIDNAGIATKEFKEELIKAGLETGSLTKSMDGTIKTAEGTEVTFKNLRTTLQDQWLTSEALVSTLDKYSDVSTEVGKKASDNATRVKTLTQLMGVLKESVQSGWASSWLTIFGDLDQASRLWTGVNDAVGGFLARSAEARNKVLKDWKALHGRAHLIQGIKALFEGLGSIMKPIKEAFRDIFPAITGRRLTELTIHFRKFADGMKIGEETAANLKRTFRGVFAVFSIIGQIIGGAIGVIFDLFGAVSEGSGSFLELTGGIGDFLVSVDKALKEGKLLDKFFSGLSVVLSLPIKLLGLITELILGIFSGFSSSDAKPLDQGLQRVNERLNTLASLGDKVSGAFKKIIDFLRPIVPIVGKIFSGIGDAIADAFSPAKFDKTLDVINTVLLGGILILVQRFFSKGLSIDFGGGVIGGITDTFGALTDTMKSMQTQIQAKTLLLIAGAIALLTASVIALSLIDSAKLQKALTAMSVGFAQLLAAMAILVKISGTAGFVKVPIIAGSMILLATSVLILTFALRNLSNLNWEEIAKGLAGIAGIMAILAGAAYLFSLSSGGMIRAGIAMIPMAIGLKIMASAVEDFSDMNWSELGKGLVGIAGALALVAAAMYLMPATAPLIGAGLILFGIGLKVVAESVKDFSDMSWKEMGKGMAGLAGALIIIAAAMLALPPSMVVTAAGLILVGIALKSIGKFMEDMGGMSWKEIGKGLAVLAASLAILAAGLYLMSGTLVGSAALLIAAAALAILAPVLVVLGSLSWVAIAKGMVALAGAFTILGLAGLILAPLAPVIIVLAASLALVGVGMALAGAGALAFATAFTLFVAAGTAGIALVGALIALIPKFLTAFAQGIVDFAKTIGSNAAVFIGAFVKLVDGILKAVIRYIPKIGQAFTVLLQTALKIIRDNVDDFANVGVKVIVAFLNAIDRNIYKITTLAIDIVLKFIKAVGDRFGEITDTGAKLIIKFINGVADAIRNNDKALSDAGINLGTAIIEGIATGIRNGADTIIDAAIAAAGSALKAAKDKLKIFSPSRVFRDEVGRPIAEGWALGIKKNAYLVDREIVRTGEKGKKKMLKATMIHMSANIAKDIDKNLTISPTISPVLDLEKLKKGATQIGTLLKSRPIDLASMSKARATSIASDREATRINSIENESRVARETPLIQQNNYSPKPLDPIEVYKNTKNLLSLTKEALNA